MEFGAGGEIIMGSEDLGQKQWRGVCSWGRNKNGECRLRTETMVWSVELGEKQ